MWKKIFTIWFPISFFSTFKTFWGPTALPQCTTRGSADPWLRNADFSARYDSSSVSFLDGCLLVAEWWSPLLCKAGRWLRPSCQWCRWGCRWLRCVTSPPASPGPSGWSSGKPPTPGSEGSWEDRNGGGCSWTCSGKHVCVCRRQHVFWKNSSAQRR